jgi:hypothetical protein
VPDVSDVSRSKPWFAAKRYGWGWGAPLTWQGWLVMAIFFAVVIGAPLVLPPRAGAVTVFLAGGAFVAVAWRTSEPPKWRWGDRDRD